MGRTCLVCVDFWKKFICSLFVVVVLQSGMVFNTEVFELNNKCSYTMNKIILTCVGLEVVDNSLEPFVTNSTQILILKNCKNITLAEDAIFHNKHPNLKTCQIISSLSLALSKNAFFGLDNLKYLQLNKNPWKEIPENTFKDLSDLEVLNVADNKIKLLNKKSFANLFRLKSLDLSQNSLETLPSYVFENLMELESLYLNENKIQIIDEHTFWGLPALNILFLTKNNLETIDCEVFNNLRNLEYLYLDYNNITYISGELRLSKLRFLQFNNNNLTNLPDKVFEKSSNLISIDLSHNKLENLSEIPFLKLTGLRHLNLYGNHVYMDMFNSLKNSTFITHDYH